MTKALRIGGFVSGAILIVFGVVVIALAINGGSTVRQPEGREDRRLPGHEPGRHRGGDERGRSHRCRRPELRRCQ